jgi:quinol-cytochrome oxidoreductase complex cytochrome b subunit
MTEVGDAVYAIVAFATVTPFTSRATVVSCTASPIAIVCFGAVMVTDRMGGLDGLSEQAVRNIVAARIAAVLILPARSRYAQWLRPPVADRIVPGCAIARYPR